MVETVREKYLREAGKTWVYAPIPLHLGTEKCFSSIMRTQKRTWHGNKKMWGSHSNRYEQCRLAGCDAVSHTLQTKEVRSSERPVSLYNYTASHTAILQLPLGCHGSRWRRLAVSTGYVTLVWSDLGTRRGIDTLPILEHSAQSLQLRSLTPLASSTYGHWNYMTIT